MWTCRRCWSVAQEKHINLSRIGIFRLQDRHGILSRLGLPIFISNFLSTTSMKFSCVEPSSSLFVTFLRTICGVYLCEQMEKVCPVCDVRHHKLQYQRDASGCTQPGTASDYTVSQTNPVTCPSIHWNSAFSPPDPAKFLSMEIVKQFVWVI